MNITVKVHRVMEYAVGAGNMLKVVLFILCCTSTLADVMAQNKYRLVTSMDELETGVSVLIASMADGDGYVMKTYESGNNCKGIKAQSVGGVITYQSGMACLKLSAYYSAWYFIDDNGHYMTATKEDANVLKFTTGADAYARFQISIASNHAAVVTCNGKTTRNTLQFYESSSLFSCYNTNTQSPVYLYLKSATPFPKCYLHKDKWVCGS